MKQFQAGNSYVAALDNVTEFGNAWSLPEVEAGGWGHLASMFRDSSWIGARSKDEAKDLIAKGWEEGAERLAKLRTELGDIPQAQSRKRKRVLSEDGSEIHIDNAMAGNWDRAFVRTTRVWVAGPQTVDIFACFGGSASRSKEEIFWCGAAAAVAADILENAGYGIRLIGSLAALANPGSPEVLRIDVPLKESGEPLRPDALAGVLCHPASFRALGFRVMDSMPIRNPTYCYWPTGGLDLARKALAKDGQDYPADSIVLGQIYTRESALSAIKALLAKVQGGDK